MHQGYCRKTRALDEIRPLLWRTLRAVYEIKPLRTPRERWRKRAIGAALDALEVLGELDVAAAIESAPTTHRSSRMAPPFPDVDEIASVADTRPAGAASKRERRR